MKNDIDSILNTLFSGGKLNVGSGTKSRAAKDAEDFLNSMQSILTTLRAYHPKRLICMFGAGGNRPKVRRFEMGEVSGNLADLSVITADNSRYENVLDILADIKVGLAKTDGKYIEIPDRREAIRWCIENAQPGDIIVLAGKGHEDYQEIEGKKYPFDERVVIREILDSMK